MAKGTSTPIITDPVPTCGYAASCPPQSGPPLVPGHPVDSGSLPFTGGFDLVWLVVFAVVVTTLGLWARRHG